MSPAIGEKILQYVGDRICFTFVQSPVQSKSAKAFLRTNIGRASGLRHDIIEGYSGHVALTGTCWRDIPMRLDADRWTVELTLSEVGFFEAKAFLVDDQGRQHWPAGENAGITVHPSAYRTGNTIYCAFTRMFGETKTALSTQNEALDLELTKLDRQGYTVIPPSGKLRDLQRELPHIFDTLGCKILHLLPVNPTPTTYARFGRFGSPYAGEDLTAIDPALVEFDKRTTGVDQFCELVSAVHLKGGRVFLDLVINHTGWGS
ncbi:MAG: amylo-alpha,6-glucosidase, partial [Verrucomicrobiales bacterium]|nr:amylo-alpha,6-glucosidase [Verrucomicrobiales bacterium]